MIWRWDTLVRIETYEIYFQYAWLTTDRRKKNKEKMFKIDIEKIDW
jgi:hypothetical protein